MHWIKINQKSKSCQHLWSSLPRASEYAILCQYTILICSHNMQFWPLFFPYLVSNITSAFAIGKCRRKVKSAGGTYKDGVKMAYWWCKMAYILAMCIEKRRQVFTRVGLLVDLLFCVQFHPGPGNVWLFPSNSNHSHIWVRWVTFKILDAH